MTLIKLLRSSSFRLAFLYMALFGVSVSVLLGFLYWSMERFVVSQTEDAINADILGLNERFDLMGESGLTYIINERITNDSSRASLYLFTDSQFQPLAGNLESWPKEKPVEGDWLVFTLETPMSNRSRGAIARHVRLKAGYNLLVGRDDTEQQKLEKLIIKSMGWGVALIMILGVLGGMLMSRGMLRRLDDINRTSRKIIRGDLGSRIPMKEAGDEFDQLAQNLNEMLDRMSSLMAGVRQVSDNIAHDLRSPLNRLRGRLELTLLEKPDLDVYRGAIGQAITSTDELIGTFNALLKIAKAEAGLKPKEMQLRDLGSIASDIAELYEPLAEENGLQLTTKLESGVRIAMDRHLLSQAIANLLDNAIKYTPAGGKVNLELRVQKKKATLVIADTGPGIPFESRENVLERFYRLERSRNAPGSGLGLSLTAAVVKLHHAKLRLEDNNPGLRALLIFDLEVLV